MTQTTSFASKDCECPYCSADQEINHDDGYAYGDDVYQQQCWNCDKTFDFTTSIIYCYCPEKRNGQ